jgi:hypothetical protein
MEGYEGNPERAGQMDETEETLAQRGAMKAMGYDAVCTAMSTPSTN